MTLYILHGYVDGLIDPIISFDYETVRKKMENFYQNSLEGISQSDEEKDNNYLGSYEASTVINGNWMEWHISEIDITLPETL